MRPCLLQAALGISLIGGLALASVPLAQSRAQLEPFVGLYEGSFESAFTEDPNDDLNFNPCDPRRRDCSLHTDPLVHILLTLSLDGRGKLAAGFFRAESHIKAGRPLDLLGRGCGTSVGNLERLESHRQAADGARWTARFDLKVANRSCLGKLRPTSSHHLYVRGLVDPESGGVRVEVAIDKAVASQNYLYVKEQGKERRVRLDLDNTQGKGRRARYRVCIENELGEFVECVVTDKELKQVAFPLPLPGGIAGSYTWWYDLFPNLKRTRDLYELEQYTARFEKVP